MVTGLPLSCNGSTLGALFSNLGAAAPFATVNGSTTAAAVMFGTTTSIATGEYNLLSGTSWNGQTFSPPAPGKYQIDAFVSVSLSAGIALTIGTAASPSVELVLTTGTASPGATILMGSSKSLQNIAGVITVATEEEFTLNISGAVQLQQGMQYGLWIEGVNFTSTLFFVAVPGDGTSRFSVSFLGP